MLMYTLICLLFVLIGITGFQFAYMFYFDRIDRERKKHVRSLEKRAERLAIRLERAEIKLAEQTALLELYKPTAETEPAEDDAWAEVLDES